MDLERRLYRLHIFETSPLISEELREYLVEREKNLIAIRFRKEMGIRPASGVYKTRSPTPLEGRDYETEAQEE